MEKISCIIVDDEIHARNLLRKYINRVETFDLIGEFNNAHSALKGISELNPQVIFLDVQMPGKTGIEMLESLENPAKFIIVFTTAYDQYALKAFETSAVDYLLKPFDEDRFGIAVEKVKKMHLASKSDNSAELERMQKLLFQFQLNNKKSDFYLEKITCKTGSRLQIVYTKDIQFIEAEGNYTKAHTCSDSYLLDISISGIQQKLDPAVFVRIHRSAIVNTRYIVSVESHFNGEYKIAMQNKAALKVSRSYKDDFNNVMGVF